MDLRNIKLTIEYDGTGYAGWQWQNNALAIQNVIQDAIREVTKEETQLIGAGRTDKGVHALGQVANFFTKTNIPGDAFRFMVNDLLPEDIFIRASEEVSLDFHARFSAKKKTYRYTVHNAPYVSPLERLYKINIRKPLDVEAMQRAGEYLKGRHDFRSFMSAKADAGIPTIRTIDRLDIRCLDQDVLFEVEAESFLYNQVRIMVGTLVHVGMGKIPVEKVKAILEDKCRNSAGITFPAKGLCLMAIEYDLQIFI